MIDLAIRRVILFTPNFEPMLAFYRDRLGLALLDQSDGWADFDAGACRLALHAASIDAAEGPHKIAFYAEDVAAARAALVARGVATMGSIHVFGDLRLCDGQDPDGNWFQLSNRP